MALLFVDGFDYYPTADIPKKWTSSIAGNYGGPTIVAQGRYGTNTGALKLSLDAGAGVIKGLGNATNLIIGFAFKMETSVNQDRSIIYLVSGAPATPFTQAYLKINGGTLTYTNGQRATIAISSATAIVPNIWYYIEYKTTISTSAAANSTVVRLNGSPVIVVPAGSNVQGDYINAINTIKQVQLFGLNSSPSSTCYIDDLYIANTSGTINNDFLGDIRIETIYPSAAGDSTQFTPTSGNNWACVSETPEDGDTSYVAASTIGTKDLYQLSDLSTTPTTVYGVQVSTIARKDDAGNRGVIPILKSGSVEYDHTSTNTFGLGDGYTQHLDMWEANPNGTVPWTGATVNALQAGIKVVS